MNVCTRLYSNYSPFCYKFQLVSDEENVRAWTLKEKIDDSKYHSKQTAKKKTSYNVYMSHLHNILKQ